MEIPRDETLHSLERSVGYRLNSSVDEGEGILIPDLALGENLRSSNGDRPTSRPSALGHGRHEVTNCHADMVGFEPPVRLRSTNPAKGYSAEWDRRDGVRCCITPDD